MLEAYAVGVRVSLRDGVTGPLGLISRAFMKAQGDAALLQKKLDGIKSTMLAGGGLLAAGALGFAALKPMLDQAMRLQEAQARFAQFGLSPAANAEAINFAKNMKVAGSSYVDNMNRMIEAQGVFRESGKLTVAQQLAGAKLAAPLLAKMDFATSVLHPDQAASFHASALSMMRFVETRGGVNDPAEFNRIANLGWKAIQSSGGNISWELMRQFMATGGTAAQGLTDKALFGQFEPIIGELKGRAGTGWMTAFNRLEGITKVPNQVAHLFVDSGLWRKKDVIWNSMGGIDRFRDNKSPLTNDQTFRQTPATFYENTILPLYAKMGLDQGGRQRENAVIFGRTGSLIFNLIDRQLQAIKNSVDAQNKAKDINGSYGDATGTAGGQLKIMRATLNDLEASAGSAILPMMVSGMKALNPMLWAFSTWTQQHPGQVKTLMVAFTGLSAAMAFGGTVLLLSGAFSGLALMAPVVAAGFGLVLSGFGAGLIPFTLVATAIAGVTYGLYEMWKNWDTTKGVIWNIKNELSLFFSWLWSKVNWLVPHLPPAAKPITHTSGPWGGQSTYSAHGKPITHTSAPIVVHNHVYIDGKQVSHTVMKHIDDQAGRPSTGPSLFDTKMSPLWPDMAY